MTGQTNTTRHLTCVVSNTQGYTQSYTRLNQDKVRTLASGSRQRERVGSPQNWSNGTF